MASQHFIDGAGVNAESLGESLVVQRSPRNVEGSDQRDVFSGQLRARTTTEVFGVRHSLKMVRVHAGRLPTEMVNLLRHRPEAPCVGLTMSQSTSLDSRPVAEPAVSVSVFGSRPNPTEGAESPIFLSPEMGAPLIPWPRVSLEEAKRLTLHPSPMRTCTRSEKGELSAPALAEFRRLLSHVGLLVRLVVGRAASTALPHYTGG